MAGQCGIEIELMQGDAAILHCAAGQDFQARQESLGVPAPVGLDNPNHDILSFGSLDAGLLQHGKSLPDARIGAEEDFEFTAGSPPLPAPDLGKEELGARTALGPS